MKVCPQCKRLSVDFDLVRGEERCLWRDCNWVNDRHIPLPKDYSQTTPPYKAEIAAQLSRERSAKFSGGLSD